MKCYDKIIYNKYNLFVAINNYFNKWLAYLNKSKRKSNLSKKHKTMN
jgi:hypothetical protein